ncbi:MAG: nitrogen regulation protein NR(II) [Pseudomonadota bacterium]
MMPISNHLNPQELLDNLLTATVVLDVDFKIHYANSAVEEVLQQSNRRLVGSSIAEFVLNQAFPFEEIRRCFATGNAFHQHDTEITLVSGKTIYPDLSVSLIKESPEPLLLIEIHHTRLEKRLNQDQQRQDQHQATTDLLRKLAHEIKNPLGGLRGAAQLLEQELPSQDLQEYTRIIILEADRLRNLVDRMLGPHRVEQKKRTNIHEVLEKARKLFQIQLPSSLVVFRDYDPSLPELMIAADQLQQAIINLLKNALQALNGSGSITIRTRAACFRKSSTSTCLTKSKIYSYYKS